MEHEHAASERLKDLALVLFVIAVVVVSGLVIVDQTIGRAGARRLIATLFKTDLDLNHETVSVPTDEFRGILVTVPYDGEVAIEISASGGEKLDMHVINGADLIALADRKPPFAGLKLNDRPAFEVKAASSTKRTHRLEAGTYVVVLEHAKRGVPPCEVKVSVRLTP